MLYFIPKISKIECQETELYMRQIWKYGGSDFVNFPSASGMASSFGLSKSITDEVFWNLSHKFGKKKYAL